MEGRGKMMKYRETGGRETKRGESGVEGRGKSNFSEPLFFLLQCSIFAQNAKSRVRATGTAKSLSHLFA